MEGRREEGQGRVWYEITYTVNLRFGLTTADRFTWTLSRRYSWLCTVTLLATVTFSLALIFFFSSSYLIVESRRPRTWLSISTFGRVSSQYVRSLNKILAHVYEKDWYIPDISCSYKMNTGSIILCLILILSVRLNASPSSLILEFRTILVDVKDMWIWKISIDHFRRSFGNELLEPRANCELGK